MAYPVLLPTHTLSSATKPLAAKQKVHSADSLLGLRRAFRGLLLSFGGHARLESIRIDRARTGRHRIGSIV